MYLCVVCSRRFADRGNVVESGREYDNPCERGHHYCHVCLRRRIRNCPDGGKEITCEQEGCGANLSSYERQPIEVQKLKREKAAIKLKHKITCESTTTDGTVLLEAASWNIKTEPQLLAMAIEGIRRSTKPQIKDRLCPTDLRSTERCKDSGPQRESIVSKAVRESESPSTIRPQSAEIGIPRIISLDSHYDVHDREGYTSTERIRESKNNTGHSKQEHRPGHRCLVGPWHPRKPLFSKVVAGQSEG